MQALLQYIVRFLDVFYLQLFPFTCAQYDMLGDTVASRLIWKQMWRSTYCLTYCKKQFLQHIAAVVTQLSLVRAEKFYLNV